MLNYKGLKHTTEWVEYPDIAAFCQKVGVRNTGSWGDGSPYYTLPVIYDPNMKKYIVDSEDIAQYLDDTYPDTPKVFPAGTHALQKAFIGAFANPSIAIHIYKLVVLENTKLFSERTADYWRNTRPLVLGKPIEELGTEEDWTALEKGLEQLKGWLESNGEGKDTLLTGDKITFADIHVAGLLRWAKVADPKVWARIAALHGGKWSTYLEQFAKYE